MAQVILKASSAEVKVVWIRRMRQLIQDTYFGSSSVPASIPSLSLAKGGASKSTISQRSSRSGSHHHGHQMCLCLHCQHHHQSSSLTLPPTRDFDCETGSLDESMENMERGSLASFGSGGTTDSEGRNASKEAQEAQGAPAARVSKPHVRPPPSRQPPPLPLTKEKEKEKVKEEVVVVEEEEEEEEVVVPAMNALDPTKRLDRLVSFLKL